MLIPLQGKQAEKSPFPPGSNVDIYRDSVTEGYSTFFCSGTVTGSLLELKGANSSCEIINRVKIQCYNNGLWDEHEKIFKGSQLRLSTGSLVKVKIDKEGSGKTSSVSNNGIFDGVILGTCDVPDSFKQYSTNDFWYSVYIPSLDAIKHEILPDHVTYRNGFEKKVKEKEEYDTINATAGINTKLMEEYQNENMAVDEDDRDYIDDIGGANDGKIEVKYEDGVDHETQVVDKMEQLIRDLSDGEIPEANDRKITVKLEGSIQTTQKIEETNKEGSHSWKDPINQTNSMTTNQKEDEQKLGSNSINQNNMPPNNGEIPKQGAYEVFITNIPSETMNHHDISCLLEKYGKIQRISLLHGCVKAYFQNQDGAQKCMRDMHNQVIFDSFTLPVKISLQERTPDNEYKLYVKELPLGIDPDTLRTLFEPFGEIKMIYFVKKLSGMPHGSVMIIFTTAISVAAAYQAFRGRTEILPGSSIPLEVVIPDVKSHKRHLFEAKVIPSVNVIKNSATDTMSEISETDRSSRSIVSEVDVKTRGTNRLMKRERVANNAQSPKKRARQKSSQGKNSPGNDLPAMHVARIYIPLPRPYVTGCIVGARGSIVRELMDYTCCNIRAINYEDVPHSVEVMSQAKPRAEAGAYHVIKHIQERLSHMMNSQIAHKCYFDWSTESVFYKMENEYERYLPSTPKGKTMNKKSHRNKKGKPTDSNWRIWLPGPSHPYKGFIIGTNGSNHRALLNELRCKMIKLNDHDGANSCYIDVFASHDNVARDCAEQLLEKMKTKFGMKLEKAYVQRVNTTT